MQQLNANSVTSTTATKPDATVRTAMNSSASSAKMNVARISTATTTTTATTTSSSANSAAAVSHHSSSSTARPLSQSSSYRSTLSRVRSQLNSGGGNGVQLNTAATKTGAAAASTFFRQQRQHADAQPNNAPTNTFLMSTVVVSRAAESLIANIDSFDLFNTPRVLDALSSIQHEQQQQIQCDGSATRTMAVKNAQEQKVEEEGIQREQQRSGEVQVSPPGTKVPTPPRNVNDRSDTLSHSHQQQHQQQYGGRLRFHQQHKTKAQQQQQQDEEDDAGAAFDVSGSGIVSNHQLTVPRIIELGNTERRGRSVPTATATTTIVPSSSSTKTAKTATVTATNATTAVSCGTDAMPQTSMGHGLHDAVEEGERLGGRIPSAPTQLVQQPLSAGDESCWGSVCTYVGAPAKEGTFFGPSSSSAAPERDNYPKVVDVEEPPATETRLPRRQPEESTCRCSGSHRRRLYFDFLVMLAEKKHPA